MMAQDRCGPLSQALNKNHQLGVHLSGSVDRKGGPMRNTVVLLLLVVAAGCVGGGGGSRPTEPPPAANASIQGTWTGTATSLSASGTCLADNFQPLTVSVRWLVQQTGTSFTASETLNNAITCPFAGTVSGNSRGKPPALPGDSQRLTYTSIVGGGVGVVAS